MSRIIIGLLMWLLFQVTANAGLPKSYPADVKGYQATPYTVGLPIHPTHILKEVLVCRTDVTSLSLYRAGTQENQSAPSAYYSSFSADQGPSNLRPILIALGLLYGGCTQIEVNFKLRDYHHCRQTVDDECGRIIVREDGVLFIGFGIIFPEE